MHFENSYNILFLYMQQFPQDKTKINLKPTK